jgi:uncharacterized surface protein with fasciclin (FAS1) repeats
MVADNSTGRLIKQMSNITQVVNTDKNMTTLKKGVHASDLDQLLSSTGPFTMFAPSDLAFTKMDKATLESLLQPENKAALTGFLNCHVVAGKISYKDLQHGQKLKTLQGKELSVEVEGNQVHIDGALIQNHDIKTTNGVIHSLDAVLNN